MVVVMVWMMSVWMTITCTAVIIFCVGVGVVGWRWWKIWWLILLCISIIVGIVVMIGGWWCWWWWTSVAMQSKVQVEIHVWFFALFCWFFLAVLFVFLKCRRVYAKFQKQCEIPSASAQGQHSRSRSVGRTFNSAASLCTSSSEKNIHNKKINKSKKFFIQINQWDNHL